MSPLGRCLFEEALLRQEYELEQMREALEDAHDEIMEHNGCRYCDHFCEKCVG